eukprot:m.133954 g.133954  ORF g.133954 m.133954 type:complete len:67 (+) comp38129_c0_seq38:138-338(+)
MYRRTTFRLASLNERSFRQETVRSAPKTFSNVLEVLLPRIQPKPNLPGLSIQDQETFVSIFSHIGY